jgi:hypothetical protein
MIAVRSPIKALLLAAVLILAGWPIPCCAQTKLYLKDGTYLLVTQYQVNGDRVHYYSVAEGQWEDMPLSLVDLKATRGAIAAKQEEQQRLLREAEKTVRGTYQMPQNTGFQIAPGIRLPFQEGLYAYDGTRLITMMQSQGAQVRDRKRAALTMAIPGPFLKGRSLVVLPGEAAAVRIFAPEPTFYAQFADGAGARIVLLRLKAGKTDREVEKITAGHNGEARESRETLPLQVAKITSILFKLTPAQPLTPGEYALGEVTNDTLNLNIWDFGINSPSGRPKQSIAGKVVRGIVTKRTSTPN